MGAADYRYQRMQLEALYESARMDREQLRSRCDILQREVNRLRAENGAMRMRLQDPDLLSPWEREQRRRRLLDEAVKIENAQYGQIGQDEVTEGETD